MRSLVQRAVDSEKWNEKLVSDEENEFWEEKPYRDRTALRKASNVELEKALVKREVNVFEFVILDERNKVL